MSSSLFDLKLSITFLMLGMVCLFPDISYHTLIPMYIFGILGVGFGLKGIWNEK